MIIFLLVVLYAGAPSPMIERGYTSFEQCEAVAGPMNKGGTVAVCQIVRVVT